MLKILDIGVEEWSGREFLQIAAAGASAVAGSCGVAPLRRAFQSKAHSGSTARFPVRAASASYRRQALFPEGMPDLIAEEATRLWDA
jgi:hypothetical protein